jgi:hypothetical protein
MVEYAYITRRVQLIRRFVLVTCLILISLPACAGNLNMRAIWGHGINEWDASTWSKIADAGVNTVAVPAMYKRDRNVFWYDNAASTNELKRLADVAGSCGMRLLPTLSLGYNARYMYPKVFNHTVTRKGTIETGLPCPLDQSFWDDFVIKGACTIAKYSKQKRSISGIHFDTEQYGGRETSGAVSDIYCFCDNCFAGFLAAKKLPKMDLPAGERYSWLKENGHIDDYYNRLQQRAEALAAKLRREVDAINPSLFISYYLFTDSWYYRGLAKGLYKKGMPLPIFDGSSYYGYLNGRGDDVVSPIKKHNPEVVYVPGFYTKGIAASRIKGNCLLALRNDGGYWIWNEAIPFPSYYLEGIKAANQLVQSRIPSKFDFGTDTSPVAPGYTGVTPGTIYTTSTGYGWKDTAPSAAYQEFAYPSDPLVNDTAEAGAGKKAIFRVDLPSPGKYEIKLHVGLKHDREWRPHTMVDVNGTRVLSGITATSGMVLPVRVVVDVDRPYVEVAVYSGRGTGRASVASLEVKPATGDTLSTSTATPNRGIPGWAKKNKFRMIYGGYLHYYTSDLWNKQLPVMNINAVGTKLDDKIAEYCRKNKLKIIQIKGWGADESYTLIAHKTRKVVYLTGKADVKPCPLNPELWDEMVVKDAIRYINAAKSWGVKLTGYVLDMEMYGSRYGDVYCNMNCFCEHCFNSFFKSRKLVAPAVGAAERYGYLKNNRLLQDYYKYLEDEMARITAGVRVKIHRVQPDLILGFMQYNNTWCLRGMARGLSSASMPVFVKSESEYDGYGFSASDMCAHFKSYGANAIYMPGISADTLAPNNLSANIYNAAVDGAGYWVFGLRPDLDAMNAITLANNELDKKLANKAYTSKLTVDPSLPIKPANWRSVGSDTAIERKNPDAHATNLVAIPEFKNAVYKLDFGTPGSPVKAGYTPVYSNTMFDDAQGYGWVTPPYHSLDRDFSKPLDDLTRDGIVTLGRQIFRLKVAPGKYAVTVILGDMNPREPRPYQNVYIQGKHMVKDVLTNGGEYRVFRLPAEVSKKYLDVTFASVREQLYTSVLGIVVEKEH